MDNRRYWLIWVFLVSFPSQGAVSISGLDDITLNAWAGSTQDLEGSDTYCITSCQGNCNANRPRDFDVAAYSTGPTDGAGNFYLRHSNGVNTLQVNFLWTNPARGTFRMSNYYVTGYTAPPSSPYAPGATNCSQVNSQNTITIRVSQVHLASALAGTYSQTFSVDMCRLQGGSPVECAAQVNFVVNLPELIQLTQLENFDFNTWAGIGSLQSSRDFCVFRNGHGGFSLNAVGSNDAAGRYAVSDGTNRIPYELEFREGGPWYTATPGNQLTSAATGFNGDGTRDCDGGTSHSIRVTMDENDLSAAQPGAYTDTLTILVQPD